MKYLVVVFVAIAVAFFGCGVRDLCKRAATVADVRGGLTAILFALFFSLVVFVLVLMTKVYHV